MESTMVTSGGAPAAVVQSESFRSGFARVEAEVRAAPRDQLVNINVDVPSVVATLLGTLPELNALRGRISKLPDFDVSRFDKLRDYALALGHTQAMYRASLSPADPLPDLGEKVAAVREVLTADAVMLAKRKLIDEASLARLRSGPGYKSVAFDVVGLVQLYRDRWESIKDRTGVREAELEEADELGRQLVNAVGVREQAPASTDSAQLLRQQAYTLLFNAYEDARRAIGFLRFHEGDADDIAPSLFAGRGGRPSREEPVPAPAQSGAGGGAGEAAPVEKSSGEDRSQVPPVAVGLPNSLPFAKL